MYIRNFYGLSPLLMNEADGGEGGAGGGAVAVAEPVSTALVPSGGDNAADGSAVDDTTTDLATTDGDSAVRPTNPALALLKAHADPEVKKFANTAHQAIAVRGELRKLFPGQSPIAATKTLISDMIGLAGRNYNTPDPRDPERRTGIQQIKDRMAEFEEVDLLFYGGDPKILEGMTADDEGKAAFAKLAPHMSNKWRQIAPNAWAAATARTMLTDMKEGRLTDEKGNEVEDADIPMRVRRMYSLLKGDNVSQESIALARAEVVAIGNYVQRLQDLSRLAPEVFTAASKDGDTKLQERERRIAERESEQRTREWGTARQTMADQSVSRVYQQLTKGRTIAADDQEDMQALFTRRFDAAIKQREPRADEQRRGYVESDDREGYLAYEKYLVDTYGIPALKMEVERMLKRIGAPKAGAPAAVAAPSAAAPGAPRPAPTGFFKLTAKPPIHVINNVGRTQDMVFKKQAILRIPHEGKPAGTKVTW